MKPSSILGSCSRRALPRAPSSTIMTLRVLYPNDLALYHDNAPATPTAPKRYTNIAPCTPTASSATSTSRPLQHLALYDYAPTTQRPPIVPSRISRRLRVQ
jgi:hypothetical protein